MPFDVWLAESCCRINNLTETSHLSKLNCASKTGGRRGDLRVFGRAEGEQRGPIRSAFLNQNV